MACRCKKAAVIADTSQFLSSQASVFDNHRAIVQFRRTVSVSYNNQNRRFMSGEIASLPYGMIQALKTLSPDPIYFSLVEDETAYEAIVNA